MEDDENKIIIEGTIESEEEEQPDGSWEWVYWLELDKDQQGRISGLGNIFEKIYYENPMGEKRVRITIEIIEK